MEQRTNLLNSAVQLDDGTVFDYNAECFGNLRPILTLLQTARIAPFVQLMVVLGLMLKGLQEVVKRLPENWCPGRDYVHPVEGVHSA